MKAVKPRQWLRVIKPFDNYPRGFIIEEAGALWREYLLARGWVELVKPEPAQTVLAGGLETVATAMSAPVATPAATEIETPAEPKPYQPSYSKRTKK